jgi:hypothetical protein
MTEEVRFAVDSPLEGTGFEPSVPRDTTKFSTWAHVASTRSLSHGEVGAKKRSRAPFAAVCGGIGGNTWNVGELMIIAGEDPDTEANGATMICGHDDTHGPR